MDTGAVVASMKSWDGIRILGVFDNEQSAINICKEARIDVESEEFCLDFIQMNKISTCQNLLLNEKSVLRGLRRVNIYDYDFTGTSSNTGNNPET